MNSEPIDPDDLVEFVRNRNARAEVGWRILSAKHRSWEMDIMLDDMYLDIFWGPLTGFGGTDRKEEAHLANAANYNPFEPFENAFTNLQDAKVWIRQRIAEE